MHLANTKYCFGFKATPSISPVILCGSQHLGSLCGDLKTYLYYLYYTCAGHTGKSSLKSQYPDSLTLLGVRMTLAMECCGFYLHLQFLPKEREDALIADISSACHLHPNPSSSETQTTGDTLQHIGVADMLPVNPVPSLAEQRPLPNIQPLHCTCCFPPQHWETLRVMRVEAVLAPGRTGQTTGKRWCEKLRGLLLKVVGRAENSLLSTGLALKPFSLLLSADVLQRCET